MVIVKKARNKYLNVSFQVLEVHTAKALASHHWLGMCSYSVEEFLQMDHLDVRELDLVEALIRWGKFQLQNNNPCEDGQKLRAKILPGLRYIRFASLAKAEMKTCLQLLDGVLSDEEKHLISTKKWKQLPLAVFASASAARRKKAHVVCNMFEFCKTCIGFKILDQSDKFLVRSTVLRVNKRVQIVGLNFNGTKSFRDWHSKFNFELRNAQNKAMGKGNLRKDVSHDGKMFFKLTPKCILEADTKYRLVFNYCRPDHMTTCKYFTIHSGSCVTTDWLTLKIDAEIKLLEATGFSMLFEKAY